MDLSIFYPKYFTMFIPGLYLFIFGILVKITEHSFLNRHDDSSLPEP